MTSVKIIDLINDIIENFSSILKSILDYEIELKFQDRASISKLNFDFEMDNRSWNWSSILKSKLDREIKIGFWNISFIKNCWQ